MNEMGSESIFSVTLSVMLSNPRKIDSDPIYPSSFETASKIPMTSIPS
jgi:hypothetical protein